MNRVKPGKRYMQYLPSAFHRGVGDRDDPFIERYLKIFERIVSGIEDGELEEKKGILEMLDIISDIFHPRFSFLFDETEPTALPLLTSDEKTVFNRYFRTDDVDDFMDKFLRWLAGWTALVLKEDWELEKKREVIAKILPIYRMRGTKKGLEEYLKIYVGRHVTIIDEADPFRVGFASCVGKNARIGGLPPYFFIVEVDSMYLFNWDKVPGKDSGRLMRYLKDDYGIYWAAGADIRKSDDGRTIYIRRYGYSAGIMLDAVEERATLTTSDGTTHKFNVKRKNGELIIYDAKKIHVSDIKKWKNKKRAIEEIITSEKPVHTDYWLTITQPRMTMGVNSNVGKNTIL